jgi:hypothetical protein
MDRDENHSRGLGRRALKELVLKGQALKIFSSKANPKVEGVSFENIISFNVNRSRFLIVRLTFFENIN